MATYDQLINDRQFLTNLYDTYKELNYDIPETNQEMVDDFLSRRRSFEDNIVGTVALGSDVDRLSDEGKSRFGEVYSQVEELPTIFEEGSAPVGRAIVDHVLYSISDPTNLLGIIGGVFTGGAATAGTMAAKVAAQKGVTNLLKNRLKASVSAPVLKAAGVDAAISGTGGAAREALIQETEQDIGVREGYDPAMMALTGVLEGPGSVLLGGVAGTLAKAGGMGTADAFRLARDKSELVDQYPGTVVDFIDEKFRTFILPSGGMSDNVVRSDELIAARQNSIVSRAEDVRKKLNKNKNYRDIMSGTDETAKSLLTRAAEGFTKDIDEVRNLYGDDLADSLIKGRKSIREASMFANEVEGLNPSVSKLFDPESSTFNPTYLRRTYEAYELGQRRPITFKKFMEQNPDAVDNLYNTLRLDAGSAQPVNYYKSFGLDESFLAPSRMTDETRTHLTGQAKKLYEGKLGKFDYSGSVGKRRKAIDPAIKEFLGAEQADLGTRIFRSVEGIMEPLTQIHRANEIGRILEAEGKAVHAKDAYEAQKKFAAQTGEIKPATEFVSIYGDKAFPVKHGLRSGEINYYVPKELGNRLNKVLTNPALRFSGEGALSGVNNILEGMSFLQGAIKLGKTAYNPVGQVRNFGGMGMSVFGSGNYRGAVDLLNKKLNGTKQEREEFIQLMMDLGIQDTGVNLRQILNRLGPDFERGTVDANKIRKVAESVLKAGKVGNAAREAYRITDDLGKFMAFLGERRKMDNIWGNADESYRNVLRDEVREIFNKQTRTPLEGSGDLLSTRTVGMTDEKVLNELAARKALNVMPTYSRVPAITEYLRGVPVVGNFMAFSAEVFRNSYKILQMGHQEMVDGFNTGNSALVKSGAERLGAISALNAGVVGGAYAWNELNGYDEIASALKDYLSFDKYNPIVITGVEENKNGERTIAYKDLGYVNPFNPLMQVVDRVTSAAATGKPIEDVLADSLPGAIGETFSPFLDQSLAFSVGESIYKSIVATQEGDERAAEYYIGKAYRTLEPGFAKIIRELTVEADVLDPNLERVIAPRYYGADGKKVESVADVGEYFYRTGLFTFAPERRFEVNATTGFALGEQSRALNTGWSGFRRKIGQTLRDPSFTSRLDFTEIAQEYEEELGRQVGIQANIADLLDNLEILAGGSRGARRVMNDPDLKSAMPRSRKERGRLLRDRSAIKKMSGNNEFWREVRKTNPELDIYTLRNMFRTIEREYDNKNLNMADPEDLPQPVIE